MNRFEQESSAAQTMAGWSASEAGFMAAVGQVTGGGARAASRALCRNDVGMLLARWADRDPFRSGTPLARHARRQFDAKRHHPRAPHGAAHAPVAAAALEHRAAARPAGAGPRPAVHRV